VPDIDLWLVGLILGVLLGPLGVYFGITDQDPFIFLLGCFFTGLIPLGVYDWRRQKVRKHYIETLSERRRTDGSPET